VQSGKVTLIDLKLDNNIKMKQTIFSRAANETINTLGNHTNSFGNSTSPFQDSKRNPHHTLQSIIATEKQEEASIIEVEEESVGDNNIRVQGSQLRAT
jgi:hypothetical protein